MVCGRASCIEHDCLKSCCLKSALILVCSKLWIITYYDLKSVKFTCKDNNSNFDLFSMKMNSKNKDLETDMVHRMDEGSTGSTLFLLQAMSKLFLLALVTLGPGWSLFLKLNLSGLDFDNELVEWFFSFGQFWNSRRPLS